MMGKNLRRRQHITSLTHFKQLIDQKFIKYIDHNNLGPINLTNFYKSMFLKRKLKKNNENL